MKKLINTDFSLSKKFEACLRQNQADQVAQIYQQRCHLNSNTNSV